MIDHQAVNLRLPTAGTVNGWRLKQGTARRKFGLMVRFC
ncbi:hypothetical protein BURMUCF2_0646 [Burkholderia multivorans CF2]|nr:hypothetical protein BURMUCF2_0646 [Burkholderia multivorans CF2]